MTDKVKELENKLHKLRLDKAGVESEIRQVDAQLGLAKREVAKKAKTKDLIELARVFVEVRKRYHQTVLDRVNSADPLESLDEFWPWLEKLGEKIAYYYGGSFDIVRRSVDNVFWEILNESNWSLDAWEKCASLHATYCDLSGKLYRRCSKMEGLEKGDDGLSDWIDSLPLAGRKVVEGILSNELATYNQVGAVIAASGRRPELVDFIQEGENYIRLAMENVLEEYFLPVVRRLEEDEDNE